MPSVSPKTKAGLRYFSTNLPAIIPSTPSCQLPAATITGSLSTKISSNTARCAVRLSPFSRLSSSANITASARSFDIKSFNEISADSIRPPAFSLGPIWKPIASESIFCTPATRINSKSPTRLAFCKIINP